MPEGLILKGIGGFYEVEGDTGLYACRTRGIFRKRGITPLPGDNVHFTITNETLREGWIEEIKERRNCFIRPPVANIKQAAVVMAGASPEPDYLLVDKLLVSALQNDIQPIIIINKTDLLDAESLQHMEAIYAQTGFPVILMNKITMQGYDDLHDKLCGSCTVFAGQSGVGKSTILNMVMDEWVMETNTVSEKIQRGRHTTRHVQLLPLDCRGYVVDTPGFSSFSLEGLKHDELAWYYPEFEKVQGNCRFHGCSHINEPGCAVKNAVEANEISPKRYECYKKLYEELKESYEQRYR
ncbi:MAG: ribosome small subunit-dependent GTPase A [Thermoclostridium sp.]|nr:ribosome small subunit-dependent GTPase A [Thermoclostridium sp.]